MFDPFVAGITVVLYGDSDGIISQPYPFFIIYKDVIDDGIQIAADVKQILPLGSSKGKNPKLTEHQRIQVIANINNTLVKLNFKLRRMNRLIRYTSLLDSWYELRGTPRGTRSMKAIVADCKRGWINKARTANKMNTK